MSYTKKKQFFQKILTIYGRKPVLEALSDDALNCYKLHLSESNRPAAIINQCIDQAGKKHVPISYHDKKNLSFISKNSKQDQGIALDIQLDNLMGVDELKALPNKHLLLLDNVTNPQNVGMIIRTAAAGYIDALIIPEKGCAELGALTIKASAGGIFKARIARVACTQDAINAFSDTHCITGLSLDSQESLYEVDMLQPRLFIVGNETEGLSKKTLTGCHQLVKIPMNNQVESLNVAMTTGLIAFHPAIYQQKKSCLIG